jgi:hypothetical protein
LRGNRHSPQTTAVTANTITPPRRWLPCFSSQVYYAALFADWLQGPYLYRLYEQYGYLQQQIAALYAIGYVAAMVSGPLLGGM